MLKGKNIILRPLKITDWEKTLQWRNNMTIKKMAMIHPFPITEIVEKEWYKNILKSTSDKSIYFAITKEDDSAIGFINLNKINYIHKNCTLGIIIGEISEQNKGYGKEAIEIIIDYAFHSLNLNKITVEVVEHNNKALNLYKKIGFIEEGRLKDQYLSEGKYYDVSLMSIFQ